MVSVQEVMTTALDVLGLLLVAAGVLVGGWALVGGWSITAAGLVVMAGSWFATPRRAKVPASP